MADRAGGRPVTGEPVGGPRIGDAFGELLLDALAEETGSGPRNTLGGRMPRPVIEIVERDDGFINGVPAAKYVAGPADWLPFDHRAVALARGRVLDVGAGGGRIALELQRRGLDVTALDISPGAVTVAGRRGVRRVVQATVDEHAGGPDRYDTILLLGSNLGLLEGRDRAPAFLAALAALARPGARIVAQGTDPSSADPVHTGYHRLNHERGRMPGQLRLRVRHRELATPWFDYLLCSPAELAELLRGTAWRLDRIDDADAPFYLAVLART